MNDAELAALKEAIDPVALGLVGLSIGSRGELVDVKGRKIHKPGFRDAIEKVLAVQLK
ncbi:gamma-mobile-trio protein GmtX [Pseudomonas sp.]|uniref:gamma-mobile-trio protein GmtX n=1 Tax=Pseudomonas sp. TaxID=306 RepID=UPI0035261D64